MSSYRKIFFVVVIGSVCNAVFDARVSVNVPIGDEFLGFFSGRIWGGLNRSRVAVPFQIGEGDGRPCGGRRRGHESKPDNVGHPGDLKVYVLLDGARRSAQNHQIPERQTTPSVADGREQKTQFCVAGGALADRVP